MGEGLRVAYATTYDPRDPASWSGTGYYIGQSLERQNIQVDYLGPLPDYRSVVLRAKGAFYTRILGQMYLREREPAVCRHYAREFSRRLSAANPDVILSPGTLPIALLTCKQPMAIWADATFAGLIETYNIDSPVCAESMRHGNQMEVTALERCRLAIYCSDWAAQTARERYRVPQDKIRVVPFGANLESDLKLEDIRRVTASRSRTMCKLLFIGREWQRKGGDLAVEVAGALNGAGLPTQLTVVGCEPVIGDSTPGFVRIVGSLHKTREEDVRRLKSLLEESHFLIMPSRAECFWVVFCEASSFGVPSLASDVGGIPTAVRDGCNGKTFAIERFSAECVQYVLSLFSSLASYEELALSSYSEYEKRLNWNVAGQQVKRLLSELL